MEINLTTPALLFPAISLLMLAYTNRFLAIANLIRQLHARYVETKEEMLRGQIDNLRRRVFLIRNMQACGAFSFLLCVVTMLTLFLGQILLGKVLFALSLLFMLTSLALSLWEISISVKALDLQLQDMAKAERPQP